MKYLVSLAVLASLCMAGSITPDLSTTLSDADQADLLPVVVKVVGRVDPDYLASATAGMDPDARKTFVAEALRAKAAETQSGILEYLGSCPVSSVQSTRSFWIVNCVVCDVTRAIIRELASREDVRYVRYRDSADILIDPVDRRATSQLELGRANAWGVDKIDAPTVWGWG